MLACTMVNDNLRFFNYTMLAAKYILVVILAISVNCCGQKGNLFLPETQKNEESNTEKNKTTATSTKKQSRKI